MSEKSSTFAANFENMIKEIPDFPKPGICFFEITPFLLNPNEVQDVVSAFCKQLQPLLADGPIAIIGPDARGFIFASMVAYALKQPFFMLRKAGKLPDDGTQVTFSAEKEYGSSQFAVNISDLDALKAQGITRAVIMDDIFATGYTCRSTARFFMDHGFEVPLVLNLIEINGLGGRERMEQCGIPVYSYMTRSE